MKYLLNKNYIEDEPPKIYLKHKTDYICKNYFTQFILPTINEIILKL
jgi:hypothetical protein